jgi:hypothetical protein
MTLGRRRARVKPRGERLSLVVRAAFREGTPRLTGAVCRLLSSRSPWQDGFDEGFWCREGLLAWEHQQPFAIMDLTFGAVDLEVCGAQVVRM